LVNNEAPVLLKHPVSTSLKQSSCGDEVLPKGGHIEHPLKSDMSSG
jgi:hypothetical protein